MTSRPADRADLASHRHGRRRQRRAQPHGGHRREALEDLSRQFAGRSAQHPAGLGAPNAVFQDAMENGSAKAAVCRCRSGDADDVTAVSASGMV